MTEHFDFKIVVAGAFAVGKTTLISAMAENGVVGTEVPTSGSEADVKDTTTVGMEYGTLSADGDGFAVELNVYGVPGQRRFSFMWDVVGVGLDGLLLMVDATRPDTWSEATEVAEHFLGIDDVPVVVAVNRADEVADAVNLVADAVAVPGAAYIACDPTDRVSARNALIEVLFLVLDSLPDDGVELTDEEMIIEQARAADVSTSRTEPLAVAE